MTPDQQAALRNIPSVEVLLHDPLLASHGAAVPRPVLVDLIRQSVEEVRSRLRCEAPGAADADAIRRDIVTRVALRADAMARPYYCKVINATGIILHTALGRAVLPAKAIRQIVDELSGYSLLQADLQTGQRSKRDVRIEALLKRLTGAPAATVVNNNAAATSIVLNTVAKGREVIVSRGQLVEIGGSFRLPDVIAASGAILVEVGTTNKTHPRDYERAITNHTAAIMRVHPSNYRISGFTSEVPLPELIEIAHARGLLVIDDVGAGPLIDFARFGFEPEPTLQASVAAGADLITASADKLIGGPQGGIILGRDDLIQAIRKNPLARVVRVDKITLAALEATLSLFLDETLALDQVPTLRMLRRGLADLDAQAKRIASALRQETAATVRVIDGCSQMGSGSLATQDLPTRLVAIEASIDPGELAARLRRQRPPVFARVHKNQLLLDPRTILEGEEELLVRACLAALASPQ